MTDRAVENSSSCAIIESSSVCKQCLITAGQRGEKKTESTSTQTTANLCKMAGCEALTTNLVQKMRDAFDGELASRLRMP